MKLKLPLDEIERRLEQSKLKRIETKAREAAERLADLKKWKEKYGIKEDKLVNDLNSKLDTYNYDR